MQQVCTDTCTHTDRHRHTCTVRSACYRLSWLISGWCHLWCTVFTRREKSHTRGKHTHCTKPNQQTKNPPLSVQMIDDINYAVRTLSTSCFSSSLLLSTNNYVFQLLCHMYATNYPTITQASLSPWHYTASLMQHKENSHTRTAVKLDPRHQIDGFLRSDF